MKKLWMNIALLIILFAVSDSHAQKMPDCNFDMKKAEELINTYRQKGCKCGSKFYPPAKPVSSDTRLMKAAKNHANDMNANHFFSHTGSDGRDGSYRLKKVGYNWSSWGENIGNGYKDEDAVVEGWINSTGHCQNIMNPSFTSMGLAKSGRYWSLILAAEK